MKTAFNKVYYSIIIFLLIGLLGAPSCKRETSFIELETKPLTGEETAQRISTLYNELGPRIGSHLVEPNVVITIAGLRGNGNFLMYNLTDDEKAKIEEINKKIEKLGLKFSVWDDIEDELADIYITNLKGFEYSSKLSKLPFAEPFDASSSFKGFQEWSDKINDNAKKYFSKNNNLKEEAFIHLLAGFYLGYPDQALLDHYNAFSTEKWASLVDSNIPYSDYYHNPQPNFTYFPEHENDQSIVKVKQSWSKLLEEFYNSSWHKSIAQDSLFKATREAEEKAHDNWLKK